MKKSVTLQQTLQTAAATRLTVIVLFIFCLATMSTSFATDYTSIDYIPGSYFLSETDVPGKLVDVGTHKLHIHCKGSGTPTVVIDTGLGAISLEWIHIQNEVADHAQICLYDRAGYGYSDPGPLPRTSAYIVNELHELLIRAKVKGPYILVGHSFGGYNVQLFASRYPEITAAVVLVDSSHMDQYARFLAAPINVKTSPPNKSKLGVVRFSMPQLHPNLPSEIREDILSLMIRQPMRYAMAYEFYNFRKSADEVREYSRFPDVPLLVLTRGKRVYPENNKGELMEKLWMKLQSELSDRSQISAHVIANTSGHFIHLDQPQLVIDSISLVIDVVRYRPVERNYPVDIALALEPTWYAFDESTWRSNRLFSDPMLGHIFPYQVSQNSYEDTGNAVDIEDANSTEEANAEVMSLATMGNPDNKVIDYVH